MLIQLTDIMIHIIVKILQWILNRGQTWVLIKCLLGSCWLRPLSRLQTLQCRLFPFGWMPIGLTRPVFSYERFCTSIYRIILNLFIPISLLNRQRTRLFVSITFFTTIQRWQTALSVHRFLFYRNNCIIWCILL